jgi:hypothetical protein
MPGLGRKPRLPSHAVCQLESERLNFNGVFSTAPGGSETVGAPPFNRNQSISTNLLKWSIRSNSLFDRELHFRARNIV